MRDRVADAFDTTGDGSTCSLVRPYLLLSRSKRSVSLISSCACGVGLLRLTEIDAWDLNGNGKIDGFDTTGDGRVDAWDTTGDGLIDAIDSNGDGRIDMKVDKQEVVVARLNRASNSWESNKESE